MTEGEFKGWYFSEELKFASENGYQIQIIKGYQFDRTVDTFKAYIDHFYQIKANTTQAVERATAKSLLNNLLGRFGLSLNKPITRLLPTAEFDEVIQTLGLYF